MMKNYAVPLSLLLLALFILLFGWGNYLLLNRDSRDLLTRVEKVVNSVEKADWESAGAYLAETGSAWDKVEKYWPMLVHHEEMDRIEESMNKLKSYLQHHNSMDSLAELYRLTYFIQHIPQKEAFNLKNIF